MSTAVVVPTIREDCARRFLHEWKDDLDGARVIVVEDNPERTFSLPAGCEHYAWDDIERDLGDLARIIPRRTSAVRSYGFWLAYHGGADVIWTLDDDCYPEDARRGTYLARIEGNLAWAAPSDAWWSTIGGLHPRGFPYGVREAKRPVMIHHGLWSQVPDLDGVTQLANPDFRLPPARERGPVPTGAMFPMCVMNLAFRREMTPAMYMLLMGQDDAGDRFGFDRFDDIWAGLLAKRICDHLGYAVTSGSPSVRHSRASDPRRNAELEAPGMAAHERLWPLIASARLEGESVAECYRELAGVVGACAVPAPPGYWRRLGSAMLDWASLFG